ncbi:hypothetical protein JT164_05175 [Helicobacter pylori]|nr:hypothetical protein [Helicobacter pylori]
MGYKVKNVSDFRRCFSFNKTSQKVRIISGGNGEILKEWDNFKDAIDEIEKLGNIRIEGDLWLSENVRVSPYVLKGLYNELISDNWERKILKACDMLGVRSVTIHALGSSSVRPDKAFIRGLKGRTHFGVIAGTFSELLLKLKKKM